MDRGLTRRGGMLALAATLLASAAHAQTAGPARAAVLSAMKRATAFMTDTVAVDGGYVWSYTADLSRRWGEMEAHPTMIWLQEPGTPAMGELFLDAYHVTGDDYYYRAAARVGETMARYQHPAGGWNYIADTAGEESLKRWYATIGKNGWRLEEFQHYYGNATFDDHVTADAARFMLRLYLEKRDPRFRASVDKAVRFVLDSQYPSGGWPQRYPLKDEFHHHGNPDYTPFITFNDEVGIENMDFLLLVKQTIGGDFKEIDDAIARGMDVFVKTQHGAPTPGWSLQHKPDDLSPAGARTYEPPSIATHTTSANVAKLMDFYQLTGDPKFLKGVPAALDWLDTLRLPQSRWSADGRQFLTHYDIETGKPIFVRRRGTNVINGAYYHDFEDDGRLGERRIDVAALRARYERLRAMPVDEATRGSVLKTPRVPAFPRIVTTRDLAGSDLNATTGQGREATPQRIEAILAGLNAQGYWPTPLVATSNPYIGDGDPVAPPGAAIRGQVGDRSDTSPFNTDTPELGVNTATYIRNMSILLRYLDTAGAA